MGVTFVFHIALQVFEDQKLYISRNYAPQFLRLSFLADNVYPFNIFPNKMPGALPCLQTLSHQAKFLLILFLSHSQVFLALGRCLLNWKGRSPLFFTSPPLPLSHSPMSSSILVSTGEHLTGSSQLKAALCTHSAVKDNSNRGRTKEKGRGKGGKNYYYTYCKIITLCNSFCSGANSCPAPLSTSGEWDRKYISICVHFAYLTAQ